MPEITNAELYQLLIYEFQRTNSKIDYIYYFLKNWRKKNEGKEEKK